MTFTESQPKLEHLAATVRVPGMPGVSYAVRIDNPYRPSAETGALTRERTWTTEGLRSLAFARLTEGLALVFGIRTSPEALEPIVNFVEYDERLFPERASLFGMTVAQ